MARLYRHSGTAKLQDRTRTQKSPLAAGNFYPIQTRTICGAVIMHDQTVAMIADACMSARYRRIINHDRGPTACPAKHHAGAAEFGVEPGQ